MCFFYGFYSSIVYLWTRHSAIMLSHRNVCFHKTPAIYCQLLLFLWTYDFLNSYYWSQTGLELESQLHH